MRTTRASSHKRSASSTPTAAAATGSPPKRTKPFNSRDARKTSASKLSSSSQISSQLAATSQKRSTSVKRASSASVAQPNNEPNTNKKSTAIRKSRSTRLPPKKLLELLADEESSDIGDESDEPSEKVNKEPTKPASLPPLQLTDAVLQSALQKIRKSDELVGYEKEVKFLRSVIRNAVASADSNSVLICGSRGSGKTSLVEHCLAAEDAEARTTLLRLDGGVDASELNAFRFITREMDIEETDLPRMMSALREKCESSKRSAIIILDEFDIFCRRNQTLLYNLFDLAQKTTYICIIGMTTRLDCIELLEKRVKSRMNQTIIQLTSPFGSISDYISYATSLLATSGVVFDKTTKKSSAKKQTTSTSLSIPGDLSTPLKQLFSRTRSVRELKRYLVSYLVDVCANSVQTNRRHSESSTARYLSSLPVSELSVLLLAVKHCRNRSEETFNCNLLAGSLHEVPGQINLTKGLLLKVINNLIDSGFLVISGPVGKNALFLTEWTLLALNVEERHMKEVLANNEYSLPAKLKQLLSTTH